jgi:hypothetical protein
MIRREEEKWREITLRALVILARNNPRNLLHYDEIGNANNTDCNTNDSYNNTAYFLRMF